jgi:hypothetical protein
VTTGAEVILLGILLIPTIAAFSILRRDRIEGPNRPKRPFWVTLGIAVAIAIPLWAIVAMLVRALTASY